MATLSEILLDAKKTVGAAVAAVGAAVAAGLIDNAQAATITAIGGAITAALVYVLGNESKHPTTDD